MAASGGKILEDFYGEIQKVADRHEHALGYAPGMDNLEMDDWSELNEFIKGMRKTYTRLSEKYHYQVGLTSEDMAQVAHVCYNKGEGKTSFDYIECKKREADKIKSQKPR